MRGDLDRILLNLLHENTHTSTADFARKLSVSRTTVWSQLEAAGKILGDR